MREDNRPRTAQAAALSDVRRQILTGELRPGQRIVQENLASRLGISRVPVREALQHLQGEGLVEYTAHHGYQVAHLDYGDLSELYYLRQLLEAEAIRLAVPVIGDNTLREMDSVRTRMEQLPAEASDEIAELNREFHFMLFRAANMPRLLRFIRLLWESSDAYRAVYYADDKAISNIHVEHKQLQDAIEARDPERVIELFDAHRGNLLQFMEDVLDRESPRQH